MKTIAQQVKNAITTGNLAAFGLNVGYGMTRDMERMCFAVPVEHDSTNNKEGRCIRSEATYEDGSILEYIYDTKRETYKLTLLN